MKRTKLPKSALPLREHALALTEKIVRLYSHFALQPRHFHDGRAKKRFERLLHRRALALEALKCLEPVLHEEIVRQTNKEKGGVV